MGLLFRSWDWGNIFWVKDGLSSVRLLFYTLLNGVCVQVDDVNVILVKATWIPTTHDHNIFCAIRLGDQTAGVVFLILMQIWSTLPRLCSEVKKVGITVVASTWNKIQKQDWRYFSLQPRESSDHLIASVTWSQVVSPGHSSCHPVTAGVAIWSQLMSPGHSSCNLVTASVNWSHTLSPGHR